MFMIHSIDSIIHSFSMRLLRSPSHWEVLYDGGKIFGEANRRKDALAFSFCSHLMHGGTAPTAAASVGVRQQHITHTYT
jgi:hypothetical protein